LSPTLKLFFFCRWYSVV